MKREPEEAAWELFQKGNRDVFNASTLGTDQANKNQFLKNRLRHAFFAGIWFQKTRYRKAQVKP